MSHGSDEQINVQRTSLEIQEKAQSEITNNQYFVERQIVICRILGYLCRLLDQITFTTYK